MDSNFNEYRREPRARRSGEKEKPKKSLTGVTAVQLVLSLVITAMLFAVCRTDGGLSQNIKEFYGKISENDMSVSQILGTFKKVAQFTFAPTTSWDGTFKPNNDEQSDESSSPSTEPSTENQGETTDTTGEKAVFSPVYLTVNFLNPVDSHNITSNFGYRTSPISGKYSLHTGLDIAAPEGSKITAVCDGVVEKADKNDMRGNYVIIRHSNSLKTTYNHCSQLLVREGMHIRAGETIALVGSTGASTGSHLHFEVMLGGKYINPLWVIFREL